MEAAACFIKEVVDDTESNVTPKDEDYVRILLVVRALGASPPPLSPTLRRRPPSPHHLAPSPVAFPPPRPLSTTPRRRPLPSPRPPTPPLTSVEGGCCAAGP